jgi:hypothetical protein
MIQRGRFRGEQGDLIFQVQGMHRTYSRLSSKKQQRRMPEGCEVFYFQENPFESELFEILERKVCVGV